MADLRRLSVIPEQSQSSSTERKNAIEIQEKTSLQNEAMLEDQDSQLCDLSEDAGSDSSDSEDDFLSSRSRVHVDLSQFVKELDDAGDEEECYTRDAASEVEMPAQGAFGPSPILARRGRGPLELKTSLRGYEQEELRSITDFSSDIEQCLQLQGGKLTNRQRRWLGLQEDEDLRTVKRFSSPLRGSRTQSFLRGGQLGQGFRRRPMWIPLSIMVAGTAFTCMELHCAITKIMTAALPAYESPHMDSSDRVRSDLHRDRCEKRVKELEKIAVECARKGQYVQVIDAVEENISVRARWGGDSPMELVGMLQVTIIERDDKSRENLILLPQSVSYLCNAYAVESIRGRNFDVAETLLARADELNLKPAMKKCAVMKFLRAGLRAATFNTRADLYRHKGHKEKAFRALQQALKVSSQSPPSNANQPRAGLWEWARGMLG